MHTFDGGISWSEQEAPSNFLHSVYFISPLEGWIAGGWTWGNNTNIILHTTNGGLLWETQYSQNGTINGHAYKDIWFTDAEHGWVVGGTEGSYPPVGPPLIRHTENGGEEWENYSSITDKSVSAVCFTGQDNGWIAGHETILHTTDGGQNWEELWTGSYSLVDICFVDPAHGWVLGDGVSDSPVRDMAMRTTDGGITWEEYFFEGSSSFKKIFFTDIYHGWIVRDGDVLFTVDGGITWDHQIINTNNYLAGVFFLDNEVGWISGGNSAIFHTENGGMVGVKEQSMSVKGSKCKVQSYPNPFSDQTTIEFYLPENGRVSLKIYDLTGREVSVLVNGLLVRGEHVLTFEAGELPNGIYLLRLVASGQQLTETKKLVLKR
jgi:photosystem II stability/assembly factor-like uncharacterized protein